MNRLDGCSLEYYIVVFMFSENIGSFLFILVGFVRFLLTVLLFSFLLDLLICRSLISLLLA